MKVKSSFPRCGVITDVTTGPHSDLHDLYQFPQVTLSPISPLNQSAVVALCTYKTFFFLFFP